MHRITVHSHSSVSATALAVRLGSSIRNTSCRTVAIALFGLLSQGCGPVILSGVATPVAAIPTLPTDLIQAATRPAVVRTDWLLHLPGIGGKRAIDVQITRGIVQGGFSGDLEIYDWTENDAGLSALISDARNHKEAKLIAGQITQHYDANPGGKIYLTCHSGGGGIAVWALEALPDRVKIDSLIMMSPALSPRYNLTKALQHVSGKGYVFSSVGDQLVLGTGTTLLGTIDGVKTDAAGRVGFTMPADGDARQYSKLIAMPYNPQWLEYGNYGNHVGGMTRPFGKEVLAPLLLSGALPDMAEK